MKTHHPRDRRLPLLAAVFAFIVALLAACGGGDGGIGSGGTGASSGYAVGTVNGFGSIYVGGVRCDDTRARVGIVTTAGAPAEGTPDVKLGQRVEIEFDPGSAACRVIEARIDPEVVGLVSSVSPLVVAGQRIVVVGDASIAPATVFEGFADASALRVGDRVEVHGQRIVVAGVGIVVRATRIERKPVSDTWVRVRGTISGVTATQFTIGGLVVKRDAGTRIAPAGTTFADGQTVVAWSNTPVAADGSIDASAIRLALRLFADQQQVRVEGPVSGCSATPCTLPKIDGLAVDLSGATFPFGSTADVADGIAMFVEGRWDAARAVLVATRAIVRLRDVNAGDVTLIGLVSDFVSASDFSVRGVPVTTDGSTVVEAGCTVAEGRIIGIRGQIRNAQVVASRIECLALADGLTLDIFGGMLNVDTTAKTFNLAEGPYRVYTLTWDDNTVFGGGLTPQGLADGVRVGLRAVLTDGKLLVKRIVADPLPTNAPGGALYFGNYGIAHDVSATGLTVGRITMNIVPGTTVVNGTVVDGTPVRTWFYRTSILAPWTALQVTAITWQ